MTTTVAAFPMSHVVHGSWYVIHLLAAHRKYQALRDVLETFAQAFVCSYCRSHLKEYLVEVPLPDGKAELHDDDLLAWSTTFHNSVTARVTEHALKPEIVEKRAAAVVRLVTEGRESSTSAEVYEWCSKVFWSGILQKASISVPKPPFSLSDRFRLHRELSGRASPEDALFYTLADVVHGTWYVIHLLATHGKRYALQCLLCVLQTFFVCGDCRFHMTHFLESHPIPPPAEAADDDGTVLFQWTTHFHRDVTTRAALSQSCNTASTLKAWRLRSYLQQRPLHSSSSANDVCLWAKDLLKSGLLFDAARCAPSHRARNVVSAESIRQELLGPPSLPATGGGCEGCTLVVEEATATSSGTATPSGTATSSETATSSSTHLRFA